MATAAPSTAPLIKGRLPSTVIPLHYDLHYTSIDLERHNFEGTVSIDVEIADVTSEDQHVDCITLHAIELDIIKAEYHVSAVDGVADGNAANTCSSSAVQAYEYRYHLPSQTCRLIFERNSVAKNSKGTLVLTFRGILNDLMHGFYRSTYESMDGRTRTIATTQFEPTDARRAFPCFDEPALKASFAVRAAVAVDPTRSGLRCFSNTPVKNTYTTSETIPGCNRNVMKTTYEFETTPLMSTYLVALIVAELDGISITPTSGLTKGITTTVYTVPGKSHEGQFCLDVASQCLELYASLFGVPYPLSKSDLVALPDFAAGAMENWGLVTYREAKIVVKESTSESMKRGTARTVCHELAHMWFGNLVTPAFWTQLWLKEGAARYLEFVGIDRIFPQWNAWEEFVQGVFGVAMNLDSLASSHPVEVEVTNADEIGEIFDSISYAKGASVIRMIACYVGSDKFFEGMRNYLEQYAYSNTRSADFWTALEDASGKPIRDIALPWTTTTGYPVIMLSEDGQRIMSPRYRAGGPGSGDNNNDEKWPIPITAVVQGEDKVQGPWLIDGPNGDESAVLLTKLNDWTKVGKWVKLNSKQEGFFRVCYTKEQWKLLSTAMSPSSQLSTVDRLGLLSDSFAAGRAGYASIVDSLELARCFRSHNTAEYVIWQELAENLSALASLWKNESYYSKFQVFLKDIFSKQMAIIGWETLPTDDQRTGSLRSTIISMLGLAGDDDVCAESLRLFKSYVADPIGNALDGDLRTAIFRNSLRADEEYTFAELKRTYEDYSSPDIQRSALLTLGRVKDPSRHREMIEYALYSGKVRFQDISWVLSGLASTTSEGGRALWQNFVDDFDSLASKFRSGHVVWGAIVGITARGLKTLEEVEEVKTFFADAAHPAGAGQRRLDQALEGLRTNAGRLERDREAVQKYFDSIIIQ